MKNDDLVIIKGAGDIASAVAHKLFRSGFKVVMTEISKPTFLRRYVSFATCIYEGQWQVEGVQAVRVDDPLEIDRILGLNKIPVIIDEECKIKTLANPYVIVDGILAKKNTGTKINDAPLVIALGPGFIAGEDVDLVVETKRGHDLGKVIEVGAAAADTGIPGDIGGYSKERLLRSPIAGRIHHVKKIGDYVEAHELVAMVEGEAVKGEISGVLRGLIQEGLWVSKGLKIGDIDPRGNKEGVYTISDKGRCIAGGVLEAIMMYKGKRGRRDGLSK